MGALGGLAAGGQRVRELLCGHRVLVAQVGAAVADATRAHPRNGAGVLGGAHVDHLQVGIEQARQHADCGATAGEVAQHLHGDFAWIGRDLCAGLGLGDAMVGGKYGDGHRVDRWVAAAETAQGHRQVFEAT